jgi:hypothetical protein
MLVATVVARKKPVRIPELFAVIIPKTTTRPGRIATTLIIT